MTRNNPKAHRKGFNRARICATCQKANVFDPELNICPKCLKALLNAKANGETPDNYKRVDTHGLTDLPVAHDNLDFSGRGGWALLAERTDGAAFRTRNTPDKSILVIATLEEVDGLRWLHVSFSRKGRVPTWEDISFVKTQVISEDVKAIMVFPKTENYVNLHKHCLHLYAPVGHDPLPDFEATLAGMKTL